MPSDAFFKARYTRQVVFFSPRISARTAGVQNWQTWLWKIDSIKNKTAACSSLLKPKYCVWQNANCQKSVYHPIKRRVNGGRMQAAAAIMFCFKCSCWNLGEHRDPFTGSQHQQPVQFSPPACAEHVPATCRTSMSFMDWRFGIISHSFKKINT